MTGQREIHDVAVIGGGPAGSTAAMCCARRGLSVLLLERDEHPRFHIGESLLPRNFALLKELGLMGRVERMPRVSKFGASFVLGDGAEPVNFWFAPGPRGEDAETFSVERAAFDRLLLDAAIEAGVEVRERTPVRAIRRLTDEGVALETDGGPVRARVLLDASGQGTVVGRHLGTRRVIPDLCRAAYYAHFNGVERREGRLGGSPIIAMCTEGWFWVIPIDELRTSIGLVMSADIAKAEGIAADRALAWGLSRSPYMRSIMRDATGPDLNHVTADFSFRCEPFAGPGHFLVGDAGTFVDPIFSTGVCMAMMSAVEAAECAEALIAHPEQAQSIRRRYIRFVDGSSRVFFRLVRDYYRHGFREMFLNGTGPLGVHSSVLAVAAGHVFPRPAWQHRWRLALFSALLGLHEGGVRLVPPRRPFSLRTSRSGLPTPAPGAQREEGVRRLMRPIRATTHRAHAPTLAAAGSAILAALAQHAATRGDATAVACLGVDSETEQELTYERLAAWVPPLSKAISAAARPGDVLMLAGPSGPTFVAWFCAALAAGVRLLPLPAALTDAELFSLVCRSDARAVITCGDRAARDPRLRRLDWTLAESVERDGSATDDVRGDGSVVLHSSGTTGEAKLAWRDGAALDADGANVMEAMRLTARDRVLLAVPLGHSYGLDMLLASLIAGSTLEIAPVFDPATVASRLAGGATVFPGVPFMFDALARFAPDAPPSQGRPRLAFSAGGVLPSRVRADFEKTWAMRIGDLYGASELGSVTFNDPDSPTYRAGCVGVPMRGVSLRVVDPADPSHAVPLGCDGHVLVKAPSMFASYLDGEAPLHDGHLLTGDLGRVDDQGRLHITGRIKLLIDTGGVKVNPLEVESALAAHPGVAECVVGPLPLSDTVTRVRATFVARDGACPPSAEELRAFLKRTLSPVKVPRVFECVDSLPKSPVGKVLRRELAGGCE